MENNVKLENNSIYTILYKINNNHEIMLPAIQRKFVWTEEKILRFVDSVLLGYPIGTFLFWELNGNYIKNAKPKLSFYSFIDYFNDSESQNRAKLTDFTDNEYFAVLDGQQRLAALNICYKRVY